MPKPTFRKKAKDDDSSIAKFSNEKISVGDIRKTQMITTFGVGSIVDFKDDTVIIASTDDWDYNPNDIDEVESRKIFNENLSVITDAEYFLMPRTTQSTNSFSKGKNIASYVFPEKLHCSRCGNIYDFRELDIKDRHRCPQCRNLVHLSILLQLRFVYMQFCLPAQLFRGFYRVLVCCSLSYFHLSILIISWYLLFPVQVYSCYPACI
jgi:hypothetical protein